MSKRRRFSQSLALVSALSVFAPQAASASRAAYGPASVAAEARADLVAAAVEDEGAAVETDGAEASAEDAQKPARKGNAFARALAAPFRALARLFGGGKSKSESAKKSAPAQEKAADAAVTAGRAGETPEAKSAAAVAPQSTPARAEEGARIVRPKEVEAARELQPKMWIPLIVGVPSDPVSQGRALLQHGYIQEAVAELQVAATTGAPYQLAEANNLLGLAYDRLGWHRQAAEAYGRALAASPKDYIALTNLGYSLYLADDYAGALKRLKQAARLAPAEPVIFNNLGVVNARLGRYGDAFKNFARATNDYEAHLKLAGILEDQRRNREAVKHYEAALRLQPGASAVLERLVALYERTGERDKADTARRALGQPRNPQKTTTGGGG